MAYEAKTKPGTGDVAEFLAEVEDAGKRADSQALIEMMREISGEEPVLWGTMVGFGRYQYRYDSGHSGEAFRIGFSPRKAELSLYVLSSDAEQVEMLDRLGKHRAGKSCLYIKRLSDVDQGVLRELTEHSWRHMAEK